MLTLDSLKEYGANTEEGMGRCLNNEGFYFRLIKMAVDDANITNLKTAVEAGDPVAAAEAVCTPVSPAAAVSPDAPFIASAAVSAAAARAVSACAAPPAFSVLSAVSAVSSLFGGLPPAALPDSAAELLPHPASITASIITSKKHNRVSVLILHINLLYLQRQLFLSIQWTPEITL